MRRLALAISLVAGVQLGADQADRVGPLADLLQRAGARVEQYLARAQSIMCLEVVHLQPLTSTWSSQGFWRTVESELRLSWQPDGDGRASTEAQTLRQLLRVNGKAPRKDDWNNCTAPEQQTSEPQALSLLLPSEQADYQFKLAGSERVDRRSAILVDYRLVKRAEVESSMVEGRDDCISFNVEGGMQGRLWIDAETHDVLRLDQRLAGLVEIPLPAKARRQPNTESSWTLERWDTTIRFKPVTFANPDETLVLPESQSSIRVTRGSGQPRLRTTITYKNYQRFVTGARVVGE
jgi:hypothetical protein